MARLVSAFVAAIVASLALFPLGALSDAATANDVLSGIKSKLEKNPNYSAFFAAYFSSSAPLELYKRLSANKRVTLFIPSAAAFKAVPAAYKANGKFGSVILYHTIEGVALSREDFRNAPVKRYWTSQFQNNKITKVARDMFTISKSTVAKNATVAGWNFWRYKTGLLNMHVVDYYFIPAAL